MLSILFLFFSLEGLAKESFEFGGGDKVHVLSDKKYLKSKNRYMEATGNVIITHKTKSLYGEKATINMASGEIEVIGNVRYVGGDMTIYGSKMEYNFLTEKLKMKNARVLTEGFVILGKTISKEIDGEILGEDAEYTTCQDCPESWTVFGKSVRLVVGKYIYITHGFIKVNGVVVMYMPYLVFPIKSERETGLLAPSIGLNIQKGAKYKQPFFWNIAPNKDFTLTPMLLGKRGYGAESQYRHVLGERKWYELNNYSGRDKIYEVNKNNATKENNDKNFRQMTEYEHHYSNGDHFNHHLHYSFADDTDIGTDYGFFTSKRQFGTYHGGGGYFEKRFTWVDTYIESYFNRNFLIKNAKGFDHSYVQILPKVGLTIPPISFLHTKYPFFRNMSLGLDSDYTVFKQNHESEDLFLRNANRLSLGPYLDWNLGSIGPVHFKTLGKYNYQYYDLRTVDNGPKDWASKRGLLTESQVSIEFEKIFGIAYQEEFSAENVQLENIKEVKKKREKKRLEENPLFLEADTHAGVKLIEKVPPFDPSFTQDQFLIQRNSYKHSTEYKLIHRYIFDDTLVGNNKFLSQIEHEAGRFDSADAIRAKEHEVDTERASIPNDNTVEFQWLNNLIRKRAKKFNPFNDGRTLREDFIYDILAYFNLSQGLYLQKQEQDKKLRERVTRVNISTGITISRLSLRLNESYFWNTYDHITSFQMTTDISRGSFSTSFNYNSFSDPVVKFLGISLTLNILEYLSLKSGHNYDIDQKVFTKSEYLLSYKPPNNCWALSFGYSKNLTEGSEFTPSILINYNNKGFTNLSSF